MALTLSLAPLPGQVRATFTFFLVQDASDLEMALAVNDLKVILDFAEEPDPAAVARAVGLHPDTVDGWRFMTAEEVADYIERRNRGDIDGTEESWHVAPR